MRIKFPSIVKLLMVLAIVGSLVAIAAAPASAATYPLNPNSGYVGQGITIQAQGFTEGQILTAKFDGVLMSTSPTTVTVPASGNINFTVIIPITTAGVHKILVLRDGQEVNPPGNDFTVTSKVVVTSPALKKGPVGTSVTVAGTGFSGAGVTADVTLTDLTGTKVLAPGVLVDSTGSFTATGTVPSFSAGDKTVSAADGAGNTAAITDTFKVTPTLTLTPGTGLAGSLVTVSGSGWKAGTVALTFAGQVWVNVTAAADGTITPASGASKQVPIAASAGTKSVVGTDGDGNSGTTSFTVVARALTLTPTSGPMGTNVLLTGTNMTKGGTIAAGALTFGGAAWNTYPGVSPYPINIDTGGTIFPTTLTVPTGATLGANTVLATDSGALIAQGIFTVTKPTTAITPITGPKGTTVTVTGSGWLAASAVTIDFKVFGSATVLGTLTTIPDGTGNIAASMAIPATAAIGANVFSAYDAKGNSAVDATFTVPGATISVTPAEGPATTSVTVSGTGFNPYFPIKITMGIAPNAYEFQTRPLSDATGAFSATVTIPGLAPGSQVISASDGTNTATAYFVIKTAPPTVASALAGISSQLVRVWGYSAGTWYMYDPTDAAGSDLASLTSGAGYWVNVNAAITLVYTGYSYPLSAGWNLIGWR